MTMLLALIGLLAMVSLVRKGYCRTPPENRAVYLAIGSGFVALAGLGMTWAGAIFAILLVNLIRDKSPSARMGLVWYPTLLLTLLYIWVPARLPEDATLLIGGAAVALGVFTGLWAWVSWYKWPGPYSWWWVKLRPYTTETGERDWLWKIGLWEVKYDLSAGQLNPNHTQGVAIVASAACAGLVVTHSLWWLLALPLTLSSIWLVEWQDAQQAKLHARGQRRVVTQGTIHGIHVLLFGLIPLFWGWWLLWIIAPLYLIAVLPMVSYAIKNPERIDSGRCRMWWVMLYGGWWTGQSWLVRLLGQGWGAWWQGHDMMTKVQAERGNQSSLSLWSCAHNDYVQMLLEHGALGLIALVGFLVERLYLTGLSDPTTYLMGIAMCSLMLLSFPVTLYHETYSPREEGVMVFGVGSPTLNVLALLIAILAGRL